MAPARGRTPASSATAAGPAVRSSYHGEPHVPATGPAARPAGIGSVPGWRRRRRIVLIALLVVMLATILAPTALAAAGGGSSGFGGGGGGHGRGAGLYILIQILLRIALLGHGLGALVLIALVIVYVLLRNGVPLMRNFWTAQESSGRAARRRSARRERQVELAAAEAAELDPAFAPDIVRSAAKKLYTEIQAAWDDGDRIHLRGLVAPDLLAEWERRLDDFDAKGWRNRVQLLEEPRVEYVGLTHRGSDSSDRAVVRIEARLRDYVEDHSGRRIKRIGRLTETVRLREFWTLGKRDGHWILRSIEQGVEGAHTLDEQLVASPWSDDGAIRDEALVEGAVADAVPEGTRIAEVADLDFEGDARAAALDLSLADGRFAPDLLDVAARRAVAAWAEAVDGDDTALLAIAHPQAAQDLLHPGDPSHRTRLVVRGPRVKQIRITGLDAAAMPPAMTIEVEIEGRRYVENRATTAVVSGSRSRSSLFTEQWTLVLDGDAAQPWRVAAVGTPVGRT